MTDASPWGSGPVEDQTIDRRVAKYLRRQGMDPLATRVARLHGDASNRCYVRLTPREGPSMVVAVHPEPFTADTLPAIAVGALFARQSSDKLETWASWHSRTSVIRRCRTI